MSTTTYDIHKNQTTVWVPIRRLTPTQRLRGYQVGDPVPLFWFWGKYRPARSPRLASLVGPSQSDGHGSQSEAGEETA